MESKHLLMLIFSALVAWPLEGQHLSCEPASKTYIRVLSYAEGWSSKLPPVRAGLMLCRDRRAVTATVSAFSSIPLPLAATVLRGSVTQESWNELVRMAQTVRIGVMKSCRFSTDSVKA